MLTQISREALIRLGREVGERGFTPFTLNRMKNENPGYAHLANYFALEAKSKIGEAGFKLALDHFAIFYRIFELSERYPDKKLLTLALERDELETASAQAIAEATNIANAAIERCRKPLG